MTGTRLLTNGFRKYNCLRRVLVLQAQKTLFSLLLRISVTRGVKKFLSMYLLSYHYIFPQLPSAACLQLRFPLHMTYLQSCYNWKAKLNNCRLSKFLFQWEKYLQCHLREARDPLFIRDFHLFFQSLVQGSNRRVPYLPTPLSDQV